MSADELRRAASLMRREAREPNMLVVLNRRTSCGARFHHQTDPELERKFGRRDPTHPSWCNAQPGGATKPAPNASAVMGAFLLAVADWLDDRAETDECARDLGGRGLADDDHALVVARAYLGGTR